MATEDRETKSKTKARRVENESEPAPFVAELIENTKILLHARNEVSHLPRNGLSMHGTNALGSGSELPKMSKSNCGFIEQNFFKKRMPNTWESTEAYLIAKRPELRLVRIV